MSIKPINTTYNGYRFRSRLEARWAVFFDALGIIYEYESEGIRLSNGHSYLPDFFLPGFNCYFEVKHAGIKYTEDGKMAELRISDGQRTGTWAGIICYGDPVDDDIHIYCQEVNDGSGGSYDNPITFGIHPLDKNPLLYAYKDRRERRFYTSFDHNMRSIRMVTTEYGKFTYDAIVTDCVLKARTKARQARFEHGETPKIH